MSNEELAGYFERFGSSDNAGQTPQTGEGMPGLETFAMMSGALGRAVAYGGSSGLFSAFSIFFSCQFLK